MYKVKDAADQLGVTRVEIFEILLSQRELFDPYVVKNNSITYISDEGMDLLRKVLSPEEAKSEDLSNTTRQAPEAVLNSVSVITSPEDMHKGEEVPNEEALANQGLGSETFWEPQIEQGEVPLEDEDSVEFEEEPLSEEQSYDMEMLSGTFFNALSDNPSVSKIESEDLLVGQWLKEIQTEDDQAMQMDIRLKEIRGQVTGLRNKILVLDSEIKRKDEAIKHYHEIMKDDLRWLEDMERKVQLIVKSHLETEEELEQDKDEEALEEDKGNFFKFFKR